MEVPVSAIARDTMTMPTESKPHGLNHRCSENRRASKPLMEKRRRARINQSLSELKSLILDAVKKDSQNTRHSKLEKADILEMTVAHLQNLHREKQTGCLSPNSNTEESFRTGYMECAREVTRFISNMEGVDPSLRSRLLTHMTLAASSFSEPVTSGDDVASSSGSDSQTPSPMNVGSPAPSCSPVSVTIPVQSSPSYSCSSSSSSPRSSNHQTTPPPVSNTMGSGIPPAYPSRHSTIHYAYVLPEAYYSVPLDLATGSSDSSTCSNSMSENDTVHIRPRIIKTDHREMSDSSQLQHDDPVWRPW